MEYNFWTGAGGVPGDYSYGIIHLISVIVLAALTIGFAIAGRKMDAKQRRKTVIGIAIFGFSFELLWRVIYFANDVPLYELYPFYPCNLAGILVPIIAVTNNKVLKEMFYVFAFVGGVVTFTIPQGIYNNLYFNFPIMKSVIQHYSIIVLPVFEFVTGLFRPKFKNIWLVYIGMLVHLGNSEGMPKVFGHYGTDYIFLNSGLPFVIDGVPGWVTLPIFGLLVMTVFYAILDIKGFVRLFRKKRACGA